MTDEEELSPRNATELYGHSEAEAVLLHDMAGGRMPHGWIFSGSEGIGKATLAYRFARALLAGRKSLDMPPEHPVFRRVAAGSHSDLLVVEPIYDPKKDEKSRVISVEQAREIGEFLSLTPGESFWRVVIVDSADALNNNAANAILKTLEEPPPQTALILISHNSGRLLPTIRSRCRMLKLKPLGEQDFTYVMRQIAPGNDSDYVRTLGVLSAFAPGVALTLHQQEAPDLYEKLLAVFTKLPAINSGDVYKLADEVGTGTVHTNWQVFTRLMLCLLARAAKFSAGLTVDAISEEEGKALAAMQQLHPATVWAGKWQQAMDQFLLAEKLHLDYKQVVITFIHSLNSKEGFQIGNAAA